MTGRTTNEQHFAKHNPESIIHENATRKCAFACRKTLKKYSDRIFEVFVEDKILAVKKTIQVEQLIDLLKNEEAFCKSIVAALSCYFDINKACNTLSN